MMQLRSNTLTKLQSNTFTVRYYIFKRLKLLLDNTNVNKVFNWMT